MQNLSRSRKIVIIISVVITLLIIAVVIAVGRNTDDKSAGTSSVGSDKASLAAGAGQSSGKEFVFQQLGIKIQQPTGLAGLDYTESPTIQRNDNRLYVTSDDFNAVVKACGEDATKSYFASVFIATDPAYDSEVVATVDGKKIAVGAGNFESKCSGDAVVEKARVLKASTKLLEDALKAAQPLEA